MSERLLDDPTLPPPGQRSGIGAASIVPYLLKSLATRPQARVAPEPPVQLQRPGPAPAQGSDIAR